jgi:hypothetical protein
VLRGLCSSSVRNHVLNLRSDREQRQRGDHGTWPSVARVRVDLWISSGSMSLEYQSLS